MKKDDL